MLDAKAGQKRQREEADFETAGVSLSTPVKDTHADDSARKKKRKNKNKERER
jgi:hypothetical protein